MIAPTSGFIFHVSVYPSLSHRHGTAKIANNVWSGKRTRSQQRRGSGSASMKRKGKGDKDNVYFYQGCVTGVMILDRSIAAKVVPISPEESKCEHRRERKNSAEETVHSRWQQGSYSIAAVGFTIINPSDSHYSSGNDAGHSNEASYL
jgi:hypothetical protein